MACGPNEYLVEGEGACRMEKNEQDVKDSAK
jgi:hypothetical protein